MTSPLSVVRTVTLLVRSVTFSQILYVLAVHDELEQHHGRIPRPKRWTMRSDPCGQG